jgi:hypothetical protein
VALLSILATGFLSPTAFAFDPAKADIESIRLYQSKDQVIAALKKRYGPTVKFETTMSDRLLGPGKRVGGIWLADRGYLLSIAFAETVPPHNTKREIVWAVSYGPTRAVAENEGRHFLESVMAKYGAPTVSPNAALAQWCRVLKSENNGSKVQRCPPGKPLLAFKIDPRLPFGSLMLSDAELGGAAEDYEPPKRPH